MKEIAQACTNGDKDCKAAAISELAPGIKSVLENHKEWDSPRVGIEAPPSSLPLVKTSDRGSLTMCTISMLDEFINTILGPEPVTTNSHYNTSLEQLSDSDVTQAYANYLTDVEVSGTALESVDPESFNTKKVHTYLKGLQPEDQAKTGQNGLLLVNFLSILKPDDAHDVCLYQYWTVYPSNTVFKQAKTFLLSTCPNQISPSTNQ